MPSKRKGAEAKARHGKHHGENPGKPRRNPAGGKAAPWPKRSHGAFGKEFHNRLKAAPPGTPDAAVLMEMFRTLPPDRLKAALAKATAAERGLIFSLAPADQLQSIIGHLPPGVFAPPKWFPPPPPPAPTGGPPASILTTTYENVPYPPAEKDPAWTLSFTGGSTLGVTSPPPWEWVSVYQPSLEKEGSLDNPMVGLTGWVVENHPPLSQGDVWFVHPFGFDFEFYIVPDPQYEGLLAASNTGVTPGSGAVDPDYNNANLNAHKLGLAAPRGVIGVETDQGLIPPAFQDFLRDGTRVATFGRWIVDCGHDDFHTEIHAPLLIAVAKPAPPPRGAPGASQMTQVQILSRPYTVSQKFAEGNFIDHLLAEVAKVETTFLGIPSSTRVEAHPTIFTTPYEGRPYIKLLVQPPPRTGINAERPQRLMVSFHFTHRRGVAVRAYDAGNGTVGLVMVLGDLNPAQLPARHDFTVQWSQLGDKYSYVIDALQITDLLLGDFASAIVLNRGILTDIYDSPSPSSPLDNQNVCAPVDIDQLQPWAGFSEDDAQPFPIYGWLNVWWQDEEMVNEAAAPTEARRGRRAGGAPGAIR